ncbi:MAG: ABC transporter substrate-binding protein [Minicystis sp.]
MMRPSLPFFTSWIAWIVGLAMVLCGCSKSERAPAGGDAGPARVKLMLNWVADPEFGGFYAAREGGAFAKNGLDVEIVGGGAGAPVVQMVASGRAEFGVAGADEILTARARGADIVPLFAVFQTSPQAIMAHAASGAKKIPDVLSSGGTLAVEPGLPAVMFLKKKYGFDKVKVVPYDGGVSRFLAEKDFAQQCFITSEPISARKHQGDPVTFLIADEGYNPYLVVAVTRRALLTEKPEMVRAFRRAALAGWRAYLDDPGPTNAVIARLNPALGADMLPEISAAQRPLIETAETRAKGLGTMSAERWTQVAQRARRPQESSTGCRPPATSPSRSNDPERTRDMTMPSGSLRAMIRLTELDGAAWSTTEEQSQRHEAFLARQCAPETYEIYGLVLACPSGVYHPDEASSTRFLLRELHMWVPTFGPRALEVGTGCGAVALVLASLGKEVTATDIDPAAIACARENADRNGLRLSTLQSDLFEAVRGEKFDLIVFNPPLRDRAVAHPVEHIASDPDGALLRRFLREAPGLLAPGGQIVFVAASFGARDPLLDELSLFEHHVAASEYSSSSGGMFRWVIFAKPR